LRVEPPIGGAKPDARHRSFPTWEARQMPLLKMLEDYRDLFVSEAAMDQFAEALENSTREDGIPLWTYRQRHLMTGLSPEATDRFFSDRILQRFVRNPDMLDTVVKRLRELSSDDLVD
jgi:hypothetical protein